MLEFPQFMQSPDGPFSHTNRQFLSSFEPHYESEAKWKAFMTKTSFNSFANKTNFHVKRYSLSLSFEMRFKGIEDTYKTLFFLMRTLSLRLTKKI